MNRAQKIVPFIILALMLSGGLMISCSDNSAPDQQGFNVGDLSPDFQLQGLDGQTVSLSDFRGKPVLINFWASWCGPCRFEMPFIQEIYEEEKWSDKGLVILAVNLGEDAATVEEFMKSNNVSFTALLDTREKVALEYNTRSIPTTFLIDGSGIIQDKVIGAFPNRAEIDRRLNKIVL